MSVIGSNMLAGSSTQGQLTVERSYQFNDGTFGNNFFRRSAGSFNAWTLSFWVKGLPTVNTGVFSNGVVFNSTFGRVYFDANRRLRYTEVSGGVTLTDCFIPSVHADPSAWTNYVISANTATAGAVSNRCQIYVNGVLQTLDGSSTFAYPAAMSIGGSSGTFSIGLMQYASSTPDGNIRGVWLAQVQLVTSNIFGGGLGSAGPNANAFGAFNSANQWAPIPFIGSYARNGSSGAFYVNFSDATSATTLGNDYSGLGNNFIAGSSVNTSRSAFDTPSPAPTSTTGNYPVWDTQAQPTGINTDNPLIATTISGAYTATTPVQVATIPMVGGKYYAELTITTVTANTGVSVYSPATNRVPLFGDNNVTYLSNGQVTVNGVLTTTGTTFTTGSVIGIAIDASSTPNTISFYINNVLRRTVSATIYPTMVAPYYIAVSDTNAAASAVITANFGQSAFTYTPPTGFTAINSQTIPQGEMTYSGTFTGNANVDGPYIYLNGAPKSLKINGNTVVFGTTVQRSAKGFKVITADAGYNSAGLNLYEVVAGSPTFKYGRGQINP
jgi:hypothetical protein